MDMLIIFIVSLFGFLLIGVPVAFCLGLAALVMMGMQNFGYDVLVQKMVGGIDSFPLLAVPFFMLAGEIMNTGGIAKRIINLSNALVGHITGGLGLVNIVASMFFGGISGSSVADTAAIGGLLIPAMKEDGYDADFSAAVTASSSTMGIVIPPSIPMILFGLISGVSVVKMFLGGIIPGILIGFSLLFLTYFISKKRNYPKGDKFSLIRVFKALKESIWAVLLPVIIIGGIISGYFTPTEAAVVSVVYALIVSLLIYKEMTIKDLPKVLIDTGKTTGIVMLVAGTAMVVAWLLTVVRIPQTIATTILSISENPFVVLLIINFFLLLVGSVMDLTPALLILGPVLLPVAREVGIDPVFFGVMMVINLGIGLVTPPVGTILYISCGIAKISLERIVKAMMPFLVTQVAILLIIIIFPQLVLWIPNNALR
ncbi:TRAP transporter large permease [Serpentinicella alkaliphila]|uniref:Tripartite ATP-independent transporter DctM subunit n=1 Tax=Serpentinicella alkaliphila TaxID=1734049 RepID=A0A4V2T328_9FIRM|nr:TRAP transporter large permease [Serpentinicella alkaliphila]TCP99823.1 tripartite ATP-independent transporter DctM subunit [Serpentinicella alkaliphila]